VLKTQYRGSDGASSRVPNSAPIGLFDSGLGGLTVLRQVYRQIPQESVLYFGDTARLPYGTRSQTEIIQFMREILAWMVGQGTKMVVMACNTSSALALETVRSEFKIPIVGLILPGARAAVQQGKRIGVIATPATAASDAYRQAILEIDGTAQVWQVGCPEFVPLIEQNRIHDPYTAQVARRYLAPLLEQNIDTLIYGCTHYPYLEPVLRQILPASVQLVDPAVHVIASAVQELELLGLRHGTQGRSNRCLTVRSRPHHLSTRFCVSGSPQTFNQLATPWLGYTPSAEAVFLPALERQPVLEPVD
jgi:glutamate racemase